MDDNEKNLKDLNIPLTLNNEIKLESNKKIDILKINHLLKLKYLRNTKNILNNDFDSIKNTAKKIEYDIKEKTSLINETIKNQEIELKKLYNEKELLNQNNIQSDIINNQQKLIDDYKKNNIELKFNLDEIEKKLEKNFLDNRKFSINNNELKNTITRYVSHNKKLQENINQLKKDYSQSLTVSQINEITSKTKFYQEENVRLSSEIITLKENYEKIKRNFTDSENEKNNIFKQIHELNNSLIKNKSIPTYLDKDKIKNEYIESKISNDEEDENLSKLKKTPKNDEELDDKINNIFK